MIYRCPWCRLLFYNDEKEYKKHIEMHVDIDIMNSKSFSCTFCGSVVPPTLHAWQKHKHQQQYMHNVSSADRQLSPVAGTSHETPQQIGHGSSETNDSTLPFSFTKVREKTFKNGVKDKLYKVKFNPEKSLEGQKLSSMHNQLLNMFDDVISEATNSLQGSDLCRVVVHHPSLTNPIYVPLQKVDHVSGQDVLQHVENVLNSHQNLEMTENFSVDVGTMELPKGGKHLPSHCLTGPEDTVHHKSSIIQIKNTDNC